MKLERRGDMTPAGENQEPEVRRAAAPAAKRQNDRSAEERQRQTSSTILYMVVLLVVALGLVALSYLSNRQNSDTITDITEQHGEVTIQALRNIEQLQNNNMALNKENDELKQKLDEAEEVRDGLTEQVQTLSDRLTELQSRFDEQTALYLDQTVRLEEQQKRSSATEALLVLAEAVNGEAEDRDQQVSAALEALRPQAQYLDSPAMAFYRGLLAQLEGTE